MKKILLIVFVLTSLQSFGGDTTRVTGVNFDFYWNYKSPFANVLYYTSIAARYKWVAGIFDSTLTVPSGTTAQIRVRGNQAQGAVFYDSTGVDSGFYVYGSGGVFQRLAKASQSGRFGVSGEDVTATANRAFDLGTNSLIIEGEDFTGYKKFQMDGDNGDINIHARDLLLTGANGAYVIASSQNIAKLRVYNDQLADILSEVIASNEGVDLTAVGSDASSSVYIRKDSIILHPNLGKINIDSVRAATSENTLLGWKQGGAHQGGVGYVTLGAGLSLASGVLSSSGGSGTVIPSINNFRLTTETGVPVSTSDRASQGTIYLTQYDGEMIALYDGAAWGYHTPGETSLALTATSGMNYDVFAFDNGGTVNLESLVWTNDNTRATGLVRVDGVLVKSGATTRRYVGTFRASGSNVTEDSKTKRFLWNVSNQVRRHMEVKETTDSWAYTTSTWRQANGATGNKVEYVTGDASLLVDANVLGMAYIAAASIYGGVGIGVSSVTAPSGFYNAMYLSSGDAYATPTAAYVGTPGLGYFYLAWLEKGGGGTCTFVGDNGANDSQTGLRAVITN